MFPAGWLLDNRCNSGGHVRNQELVKFREGQLSGASKPPKNRFLAGAHVSEATLARLLFLWLDGRTYSEISESLKSGDSQADAAITQVEKLLGDSLDLRENRKRGVSRQASHAIVGEVALLVISLCYLDRLPALASFINGRDPFVATEARRVADFLGHKPDEEEAAEILEQAGRQSVTDFITAWGKIVFLLSSNQMPYEAIRAVDGIKPFDVIQDELLLEKMRERFARFRGYKVEALKAHIGHYFCLRNGLDYLRREQDRIAGYEYALMNEKEREQLWHEIVVRALMVLLCQLQSGATYSRLRAEAFDNGDATLAIR